MTKINVYVDKILIGSQLTGKNEPNAHMQSTVFLSVGDTQYQCMIRQPYGENFSYDNSVIEVEIPDGLRRVVNNRQFRELIQQLFTRFVKLIFGTSLKNLGKLEAINTTFKVDNNYEIDAFLDGGGAW